MKLLVQLTCTILFNLVLSFPTSAEVEQKKDFGFPVDPAELLKGDLHFALELVSPKKLSLKYPNFYEMDSLGIIRQPKVSLLLTKSAYIVNKPVGFFDHLKIDDKNFYKHILGAKKVEKVHDNTFVVTMSGNHPHSFKMQTFFDSDDITTLPNSRVSRAVTEARKLDVISQSASSLYFREQSKYNAYAEGGVHMSTFIPIKENKTLILSYGLIAIRKPVARKKELLEEFVSTSLAQKKLIESYP